MQIEIHQFRGVGIPTFVIVEVANIWPFNKHRDIQVSVHSHSISGSADDENLH